MDGSQLVRFYFDKTAQQIYIFGTNQVIVAGIVGKRLLAEKQYMNNIMRLKSN